MAEGVTLIIDEFYTITRPDAEESKRLMCFVKMARADSVDRSYRPLWHTVDDFATQVKED